MYTLLCEQMFLIFLSIYLGVELMGHMEKEMATHSSILAWEIHGQWSLAGYSPEGCKRVQHDSATKQQIYVSPFQHEINRNIYKWDILSSLFSYLVLEIQCIIYIYSSSQFSLATLQLPQISWVEIHALWSFENYV